MTLNRCLLAILAVVASLSVGCAGHLPWHQPTQALAVIRRAIRDQSRLWDDSGGP